MMEAVTTVNEVLKWGMDGVLLLSLIAVWRAYQAEIQSHRADLLRFLHPPEKAVE